MRIVCSVCKCAMGTKEGPENQVSHSLCSAGCEVMQYDDLATDAPPECERCDVVLTPDNAAWIGEGEELVCRACADACTS